MVGLCLSSPHMTSPHLVLLHFRFSKTITNLNTIGRSATSENLGICLLIRLSSSGFRGLLDALMYLECGYCSFGLLALLVLLALLSRVALLDIPDF